MSNAASVGAQALTTISGGINRLRGKGGADKNSLYDLLNGYVTQANTVRVRPGCYRNANISQYSGVGNTKGLMAYQGDFHVFSASVVDVPPGYELHVLNYPSAQNSAAAFSITEGQFAATTSIGSGSGYGLVSASYGFAKQAIINPQPSGDVGSCSPTTAFGATIEGMFQAIAGSTHDAGEVYIVFSATPAIPPNGITVSYNSTSGPVSVALTPALETNVLALGSNYVVYALGTGAIASDPQFADVGLLLHCDGANGSTLFPDSSNQAVTVTAHGSVAVTTAQQEFGTGSMTLGATQGANQYCTLSTVGQPLLDLTGDFTIEGWLRINAAAGSYGGSIMADATGSNGWFLNMNTSGSTFGIQFVYYYNTSAQVAATSPLIAETKSAWISFAVVKSGLTITCYLNGVAGVPQTFAGTPNGTTGTITIGTCAGASYNVEGYLDEIRITAAARYATTYTPAGPFGAALAPSFNNAASYPIKEIHFAAPYLGGIYVVAEFDVPSALAATNGTVAHYWIQSSTGSDNADVWLASTDYQIGDVVIPPTQNGLTYVASRAGPANPLWTADTLETDGNVVEPNVSNGYKYTVTATEGANPSTGATEPTWPTSDGAVVMELSSVANDQTITLASAAPNPPPATPPRYIGLYTPPAGG